VTEEEHVWDAGAVGGVLLNQAIVEGVGELLRRPLIAALIEWPRLVLKEEAMRKNS
jgi:hypothetical protein